MADPTPPTAASAERIRFDVTEEDAGLRLDQVVARRVPDLSRRKARLVIELGGVFVDRSRVKVLGRKVWRGQRVEVHLGGAAHHATPALGAAARERDAARLPSFTIVHEDDHLIVVDKPSGLLTAPTPESDRNNLADLLERRPGVGRVWVVHRLDMETSGLLVFAKTAEANRGLAELFRTHDVDREYLAVVDGALGTPTQRVDVPIAGRMAVTHVSVLQTQASTTLVRVRLETGRTHQVRIHMRSLGHPVCGDGRYGERRTEGAPRLALHATRLGFVHPVTGARAALDSTWPPDLAAWISSL